MDIDRFLPGTYVRNKWQQDQVGKITDISLVEKHDLLGISWITGWFHSGRINGVYYSVYDVVAISDPEAVADILIYADQ